MGLPSTGIRFRLLALVCVSLLPVLLFSLSLVEQRHSEESDDAREQLRTLARLTAASHANILAQSHQLLAGLVVGNDSSDDPLLGPKCGVHLQRIIKIRPIYRQLAVAKPNGEVFTAIPLPRPVNLGDRDYFSTAVNNKSPTHSSIVTSRLTGSRAITLVEPVLDENNAVMATIVAVLGFDWVGERLSGAALPKDAGVALIDSEGMALVSFPVKAIEGRPIAEVDEFKRNIRNTDEGMIEGPGLDGIERVRAYVRLKDLPGPGIYLRIGFAKTDVNAAAMRALRNMVVGLALALIIAMIGAWVGASAFVVRPLRLLTRAAERLGKGDLSTRTGLAHKDNEIGELACKFDDLAAHVQRTNRAFRALSAGNRLILRERDEKRLLDAMCSVAVETGGYAVAVVTYVSDDAPVRMRLMAVAGDDSGFLEIARTSIKSDADRENGTLGRAVRTGRRSVIENISASTEAVPWRDAALERGFCSIASFPLKIDGVVIGVFTLVGSQEGTLDEDELELLDEMAADLSFGIAATRVRGKLDEAEQVARRAATHDLLTDLPNAAAFLTLITRSIAEARAANEAMAVIVIHLARLQDVYESLGYEPGNLIVQELAQRLRGLPEVNDSLSRIGLEEFALGLRNSDARAAADAVRSIIVQFQAPVHASGAEFEIQAAVGASYFPGHGDGPELLVRRATIAARDAAHRGVTYLPYKGKTEREDPQRLVIAGELRQAIEQQVLTLYYQPKVDLRSDAIVSFEGLIRWPHPAKGMIPPGQFIPIAEQTGLIRDVTYYVIDVAVRQARAWLMAGHPVPIAVNLSARNLFDASLTERIEGLLATWGVPPELIEFEITESTLMEEPDIARAVIAKLGSRGSKIYIDDFGTGHSSLSYLVTLPVHALKIDRAFVIQMTKSHEARAVVASVITLAHELGLRVVAEGVETAEERDQLKEMNCDEVQGYFTGRPASAEALAEQLSQRNASEKQA